LQASFHKQEPQKEKFMSLIKREKTAVLKRFTVRIDTSLLADLSEYAEYMASSKDHVISEAIKYIIDRDKEYQNSHQLSHQNVGGNVGETPQQKTAGK